MYVLEFRSPGYMFKKLDENQKKEVSTKKNLNKKGFLAAQTKEKNAFMERSTKPKIGIL